MGFALAATACAKRSRWVAAGILVALAVLSQQFALLVAGPLLVLAPPVRRWRYVGSAVATATVIALPILAFSSGSALRAITLGSGNTPSIGGTALWQLHLNGLPLVLVSRILPLALAILLVWWVVCRAGAAALASPVMTMSLIATSLSFRLIFEQNLFAYYFMALVVTLVLVDVARGRVRGSFIAWLSALTMVFCVNGYFLRVDSGLGGANVVPPLVLGVALTAAVIGVIGRRPWSRWNLLLWSAVVVCAVVTWSNVSNPLYLALPTWFWQALFAGTGTMLAVRPVLDLLDEPGIERRLEAQMCSRSPLV